MQRRYIDRGRPFDFSGWKALFSGMFAPGVYQGFDITVDGSGNVILGSLHSEDDPGLYMLPSGIAVSEDSSITVPFSVPGSAQDFTIRAVHEDNGLIGGGGVAATYTIVDSLLTEQPSDGVIIGWIRYDGTGALTLSMITPAPKLRGDEIDQVSEARASIEGNPPRPILDLASGAAEVTGVETTTSPFGWHGVSNAVTAATLVSVGYFHWRVLSEPFQIVARSILPSGTSLGVEVLDTAGTVIAGPATWSNNPILTENVLAIPQGSGTWTENGIGTVRLTYRTPITTIIKIHRLIVDNWPFATPRT